MLKNMHGTDYVLVKFWENEWEMCVLERLPDSRHLKELEECNALLEEQRKTKPKKKPLQSTPLKQRECHHRSSFPELWILTKAWENQTTFLQAQLNLEKDGRLCGLLTDPSLHSSSWQFWKPEATMEVVKMSCLAGVAGTRAPEDHSPERITTTARFRKLPLHLQHCLLRPDSELGLCKPLYPQGTCEKAITKYHCYWGSNINWD